MNLRPVTPHREVDLIVADRFVVDITYANWRPHGTRDWLLIYTESGAGRIGLPSGSRLVRKGEVILYRPQSAQDYATALEAGSWKLLWSHFHPRPHWFPWLNWTEIASGIGHTVIADETLQIKVRRALLDAIKHGWQGMPESKDLAMNALELALLWIHASLESRQLDSRVRKAADFLMQNLQNAFHWPALADQCGLSVSRLAHLFKEQMGCSPQHYHERARLQRAAQMLRSTGLSVGEIAEASGYLNAYYFSNRFKLFLGLSPSAYREKELLTRNEPLAPAKSSRPNKPAKAKPARQ